VEAVVGHHAGLMADAGHQVQIVAGRGSQTDARVPFLQVPLADSRHPEILSVKAELDQGRIPAAFDELVSSLTRVLVEILADRDFLIAHNVCSLNKNLVLTAALKRIADAPDHPRFILWHHDLAWTTPRYRDELYDGYPWDLLRTAWPDATQIVVSEFRRTELSGLIGLPSGQIHVVPNGIDIARFLKLEERSRAILQRLPLLGAAPVLLLPVRITPRKNIELALRTLRVLKETHPYAMLVVTGPLGAHNPANVHYFERLLDLRADLGLGDSAHFLAEYSHEFLPDEVISDFYQLSDALLLPSREEGFGLPLLEAGLARLPLFCADIPPLRELADGYAHFFSPEADPAAVAELISSHLPSARSYQYQSHVRTRYTWSQIYANRIEPLFSLKVE